MRSNWTGFEGSTTGTGFSQQFTVATESLNAIIGTIRPGNYDAQTLPQIGGLAQANNSQYIPQTGGTPTTANFGIQLPTNSFFNWYHTCFGLEPPVRDYYKTFASFGANYQCESNCLLAALLLIDTCANKLRVPAVNIDSKLYPQFLADAHDCWHLLRNMFDANALSLTYGSSVQNMDQFISGYFGTCVGLDHHADDAGKDHLISGLNTTGSLIPIVYNVNGNTQQINNVQWLNLLSAMCGNSFRPTVFCNLTSTLMVYQGRVISVVN